MGDVFFHDPGSTAKWNLVSVKRRLRVRGTLDFETRQRCLNAAFVLEEVNEASGISGSRGNRYRFDRLNVYSELLGTMSIDHAESQATGCHMSSPSSFVPFPHELEQTLGDGRGNFRPVCVWSSLIRCLGPTGNMSSRLGMGALYPKPSTP